MEHGKGARSNGILDVYYKRKHKYQKQANNSGGVMERKMSNEPITIYIGVESVNDYAKKVEELGDKVIKPRTEVPGYGWFAVCMDTENNLFALWETSATNTK
jgi:predicted enzyme related to lactoylglutathione lyase